MGQALIWISAYLFTGLSYATYVGEEPEWNRPRALESKAGCIGMIFLWPMSALMSGWARVFSHIILLLLVGGIGEAIHALL
jgi:hypothetical protein